ncbi:MAG: PAS/PAC and GAF sensor-containing diguanylate cyclase/phosphodiesterase, partial [Halothiobacillaceae bacterium]
LLTLAFESLTHGLVLNNPHIGWNGLLLLLALLPALVNLRRRWSVRANTLWMVLALFAINGLNFVLLAELFQPSLLVFPTLVIIFVYLLLLVNNFNVVATDQAAKLLTLSNDDLLTGLPNRAAFKRLLEQMIHTAKAKKSSVALIWIDLDHFQTINSTMGHHIGDQLLVEASKRLHRFIQDIGYVTRIGGDEFAVLIPFSDHQERVIQYAEGILRLLEQPYRLADREFRLGASLGIALYPADGEDANSLEQHADAAMFDAKRRGRRGYQFYTPVLSIAAQERVLLENELHNALKQHQFLLQYQPQIDIASGEVVAVEALLRWNHPQYGLLAPDRFISIAEESGLILPIGTWVLE